LPLESKFEEGSDNETNDFINSVNETEIGSANPKTACLANTVLLWNVFQHFYPYFEQVDCDWDQSLTEALERGTRCGSREDTTKTLQWLVAQLHDGHGMVFDTKRRRKLAKVAFSWVENQLLVVASEDPNFEVGDIVTKIGEKLSIDYLAEQEELISGSPQWKRHRSVQSLAVGTDSLELELKRKTDDDDEIVKSELTFTSSKPFTSDKGEICRELVEGGDGENIWYIDLGRAEPNDVDDKIKKFATAKGVVLDLRGYPRGTQYLFQHMTDQHMQSQKWQTPQQVRPNGIDMKEIKTGRRWEMPPREPRFQGKMVFITNASAISYAESCMSIVAHYKLGEIIGSPTAGANGNVNPFSLPGGYRVSWTGMRVMNHDDSQHHVRGVQPTIPMAPTIEGIRQGKDELLERAIELIKGS
jgi:C-terminal processing protease CtpA/Prc